MWFHQSNLMKVEYSSIAGKIRSGIVALPAPATPLVLRFFYCRSRWRASWVPPPSLPRDLGRLEQPWSSAPLQPSTSSFKVQENNKVCSCVYMFVISSFRLALMISFHSPLISPIFFSLFIFWFLQILSKTLSFLFFPSRFEWMCVFPFDWDTFFFCWFLFTFFI